MNATDLLELLNARVKSTETTVEAKGDYVWYHYARTGWQRLTRVRADAPLETHQNALNWTEAHA